MDLLGTPSLENLRKAGASEGATKYILQRPHKPVSIVILVHYAFSSLKFSLESDWTVIQVVNVLFVCPAVADFLSKKVE